MPVPYSSPRWDIGCGGDARQWLGKGIYIT